MTTTIQRRKAAGLCVCGKARDNETIRCTACREKHRIDSLERMRAKSEERRAKGLCIQCGRHPPTDAHVRCERCHASHVTFARKAASAQMAERVTAGVCIGCGKPRNNETTRCDTCREEHNASTSAAKADSYAAFDSLGVCVSCGCTRDNETKLCNRCRTTSMSNNRIHAQAKRDRPGICDKCTLPTWTPEAPSCQYHYTYNLVSKFLSKDARLRKDRTAIRLTHAMMQKLYAQGGACAYSDVPLKPAVNMSIDHVWPRCKFPALSDELTNMVWVSRTVNNMKGIVTPTEPEFLILDLDIRARISTLANQVEGRPHDVPPLASPRPSPTTTPL